MSQAPALARLDRLARHLDRYDALDVSGQYDEHPATVLLAALDAAGVNRGLLDARYARGDEATAAALLRELADDHPRELGRCWATRLATPIG